MNEYADRREVLARAVDQLGAAGVPSPDVDARLLLAETLGVATSQVGLCELIPERQAEEFAGLVARRGNREPLQHILGKAWFRHLELAVGPGVFVPRPETEILVDLALEALHPCPSPVVVDLCTGSAAIPIAIATESCAAVFALESDESAFRWAQRNVEKYAPQIAAAGSTVILGLGDARRADAELADYVGRVDLVSCNPPYIPTCAVPRDPEVRDYDPPVALYGGEDGLDIVRDVIAAARFLLKPGGTILIEHGDEQGTFTLGGVPQCLVAVGSFTEVTDHTDLAGRPRHTSARLGDFSGTG